MALLEADVAPTDVTTPPPPLLPPLPVATIEPPPTLLPPTTTSLLFSLCEDRERKIYLVSLQEVKTYKIISWKNAECDPGRPG